MVKQKPIQLWESTHTLINENRKEKTISAFIDEAVKHYIAFSDNSSVLRKIYEKLDSIDNTTKTNLGLNCEVLQLAGILNGNGEITPIKKG